MQKTTLIIDNILTPYIIARYNAINSVLHGNLQVLFQAKTEMNRSWKKFPEIQFSHDFLDDFPIKVGLKDSHSFHINLGIVEYLNQNKQNVDRVIVCGWDSLTYWYSIVFCFVHKIRVTLWAGSTKYEKSWRRTLFMPVILILVRMCNDFIAYGSRAKEFLTFLGANPSKIQIFTNSVDVNYYSSKWKLLNGDKQVLRKKWGVSLDHHVFLFVGQLIERKGIVELLASFSKLSAKVPSTSLVIVGQGVLYTLIEQYVARTKINVVLISHTEYSVLPEIYALADVLVLPSKEEVWGLVVNEALASRLPVIVSDKVGAGPDLVIHGKNGYTYQSGSVTNLTKYLLLSIIHSHHFKKETVTRVMNTDPNKVAKRVFYGEGK